MKENLEKRQSEVIEMNFSEMNVYHLFSEGISHNLSRIRNPLFFFFSGFFFFRKLEKWSLDFYHLQLKKRVISLLLPYLLWNILMILAVYIKNYAFIFLFSMEPGEELQEVRNNSLYMLFWHTPVNYPLWFLRDLICMSALSPLFYAFFKYLKIYGLLILLALYLSVWETNIAGLSMTAIMFFGAGSYMGIYKKNVLAFCSKFRYVTAIITLMFLCCAIICNGRELHAYIVRIYILFGIITAFNLMDWLIDKESWKNLFCKLSATVFFIYAAHEIYIINWTKGFFSRTSLADSGGGLMLSYLLIPFITLGVCLGLYYFLNRMAPNMLALLVGGRMKTQIIRNSK